MKPRLFSAAAITLLASAPAWAGQKDADTSPPGYWRATPDAVVLRYVPSTIGLSEEEEAFCGKAAAIWQDDDQQAKYEDCIRLQIRIKRRNAADDAICKSYGVSVDSSAYAQCRENLVNQRGVYERALLAHPLTEWPEPKPSTRCTTLHPGDITRTICD
ncbi:MAG: hypothetical protein ACLQJR_10315 [Stellaceae bacterium]